MTHKVSTINLSIRQALLLIILLACTMTNSGCFYYKSVGYSRTDYKPKKFCKKLQSSITPNKYVIVHQDNDMWHMYNVAIDVPGRGNYFPCTNTVYGYKEEVDSLCAFYHHKYVAKDRRAVRYYIDDDDHVTSQVHVYVKDSNLFYSDSLAIPVSSINRVEEYRQATFRSQWPWIVGRITLEVLIFCISPHGHSHSGSSSPRNTSHSSTAIHAPRTR